MILLEIMVHEIDPTDQNKWCPRGM